MGDSLFGLDCSLHTDATIATSGDRQAWRAAQCT
jgi:hypothetical protein